MHSSQHAPLFIWMTPLRVACSLCCVLQVCLLVHLDGQAWLADVAGGGLSVLRSADCFPGTPVEPLLFEAGLEQVKEGREEEHS